MKLKYILIGVLILVGGVITAEAYSDTFGRDTAPSSQLKSEVARTQRTARDLDRTYTDIMPPAPPGLQSPAAANPEPDQPDVEESPPGEPPPPGTYTDSEIPVEESTPPPAPYETNTNPADEAALEAVRTSREQRTNLEAQDSEYAAAVETFYNEWTARYQDATAQHRRFRWRLEQADRRAAEYFRTQTDLTSRMPNATRKAHYQAKDQEERQLYTEWQVQAHDILGQSNIIMLELRQLNLEITKQTLSADFATLYQEFHQIPAAISTLHTELDLFRQRSEQLENQFNRG